MRTVLKGAPAEQKRQWFSGLAQAAGNDYEGYSAVMAQLAPDDPVTAVAGTYAYRGRTEASDLMLRGQAILNPVRKEDGKPDHGKLWPMPPEAICARASSPTRRTPSPATRRRATRCTSRRSRSTRRRAPTRATRAG
jgi:hypothetical protein